MQIKFLPLSNQWLTQAKNDYTYHAMDETSKAFSYRLAVYCNNEILYVYIAKSFFDKYATNTKEESLKICTKFTRRAYALGLIYKCYAVAIAE
jgi:hypothetical protein